MLTYFTQPLESAELFGSYAWFFFVVQILAAALGAYFIWLHTERSPIWRQFYRALGIGMMVFGIVGTIVGSLRLAGIAPFNLRLWFYVLLLIELGAVGYVTHFVRNVMPVRIREARNRPLSAPRQPAAPVEPKPQALTSRRDARRDRKRKGR